MPRKSKKKDKPALSKETRNALRELAGTYSLDEFDDLDHSGRPEPLIGYLGRRWAGGAPRGADQSTQRSPQEQWH